MSTTTRLAARYRSIDAQADRMLGTGETPATPAPRSTPAPTLVHTQTLDLIDHLFSMVGESSHPILPVIRTMRTRFLRDFASVPPEKLTEFLHDLGARMLAVGSVPDGASQDKPSGA